MYDVHPCNSHKSLYESSLNFIEVCRRIKSPVSSVNQFLDNVERCPTGFAQVAHVENTENDSSSAAEHLVHVKVNVQLLLPVFQTAEAASKEMKEARRHIRILIETLFNFTEDNCVDVGCEPETSPQSSGQEAGQCPDRAVKFQCVVISWQPGAHTDTLMRVKSVNITSSYINYEFGHIARLNVRVHCFSPILCRVYE